MSMSEVEGPKLPLPKFDWTINLGHLLTISAMLIALATAYTTYQVTINDHDSRLRSLERQTLMLDGRTSDIYKVLSDIRQDLAIIKYRMDNNKATEHK